MEVIVKSENYEIYKLEKSIYSPVIVPPTIIQSPTINDTINGEAGSSSSTDSLAPTVPLYLSCHKVKSQENLKNIALKYNVTVENIMEWNNLRSTSIYVGQKLKVYTAEAPQVAPTPPPPAVTKKYYNNNACVSLTVSVYNVVMWVGSKKKTINIIYDVCCAVCQYE